MKYFLVLYISIAALLGGLANAAKIHQMKDSEAKQIQPCEEKGCVCMSNTISQYIDFLLTKKQIIRKSAHEVLLQANRDLNCKLDEDDWNNSLHAKDLSAVKRPVIVKVDSESILV